MAQTGEINYYYMKKIGDINNQMLKHIYAKINQLKSLQIKFIDFLPEDIKPHCRVANFEQGILKIAVSSPVWAMRLRYIIPDLLSKMRRDAGIPQLSSIEQYVEPDFSQLFRR
jgi:hypothetical protein